MQIPENLHYSEKHHWFREADGAVGITDYAQNKLGTIVYVDLPQVGDMVQQGTPCGSIESTKANSDLYPPVSGRVSKINEEVVDDPEPINRSPYEKGWLFIIEPSDLAEKAALMDHNKYAAMIGV